MWGFESLRRHFEYGYVAQQVEAGDLKSLQCRFESDRSYFIFDATIKDMDQACILAREYLRGRFDELKEIHPEFKSIGTPSYMIKDRICFGVRLHSGAKKSIQYARLLLELKIGRKLNSNETVDHIDFDSTNNSMDNLQLLTRQENACKGSHEINKRKVAELNSLRMMGNRISVGNCNGMTKLSDIEVDEIKILQRNHYRGQDRVLANQFGVSRELISQIRRCKVRVDL